MKIVFPYHTYAGSPGGSPTGWNLNIARLFELRGHEVYFGVEQLESKADVLFVYNRIDLWEQTRSEWEACRRCADKILLGAFDPNNPTDSAPVPKDCLLVTPFRNMGKPCMVLPYAFYETVPTPKFSNKTIGWTVRNAFVGSGELDAIQRVHLAHLEACQKLVQIGGFRLVLFSNNAYYDFPTKGNAQVLLDSLRSDSLVRVVNHLPYEEYLSLLGETSVVIPLNGIGSTTEALRLGSLPLSWENVVNVYANSPGNKSYASITFADVQARLLALLTDEKFYVSEYQRLLSLAAVYSLDEALSLVDQVIERL